MAYWLLIGPILAPKWKKWRENSHMINTDALHQLNAILPFFVVSDISTVNNIALMELCIFV
jgi:hypothetical protein